jgi:hypothetical protein
MTGPIVRSGATPEFSKNWENIFGKPAKSGTAAGKAKKNATGKKGAAAAAKASTAKGAKTKPTAKKATAKKTAAESKKAVKK